MPDNYTDDSSQSAPATPRQRARRAFLLRLLPVAVFSAVGATLATAAFKFLRPRDPQADDEASWTTVAPVSELTAAQPVARKVFVERDAGWTRTREERLVFVLAGDEHRVVSAVCTHEGCEVAWRAQAGDFFCPCHDSVFDARGRRVSGPAQRDLEALPTRIEQGHLQVQYKSFVEDSDGRA
ncbi:MAG TPA: ubiquinol-cytochrome c reductase iron-sulfur subunit [Pyrinomonadaceae bacterium]|nr:ubiquinol-cytochrome c reductase iron-sulfur subunit [Pyrinomonadaceae bacterium]